MLLKDTVQCPSCKHILDQTRYSEWTAERNTLSAEGAEDPCPNCGEMVRRGLVRCWKCSTFMQPEIADVYREMQSSPQPVIYSPLPEGAEPAPEESAGDDDEGGFELTATYRASSATAADSGDADTPPPPPETSQAESNGDAEGPPPPPDPDAPGPIAADGDTLLEVALAEEAEVKQGRRTPAGAGQPRSPSGVLVYCPNGHRIEVEDRHRGKMGRCPKCKTPFFVPLPQPSEEDASPEAPADEPAPTGIGKYRTWLTDVRLHVVQPEKLKLKAGSLKADFQLFDVAFADDEILLAALTKKKGAAGATSKKRLEDREKLQEFLRNGGPLADLPAAEHFTLTPEQAQSITVVQPALNPHESMFAGIPVLGEGLIGVYLPVDDDPAKRRFLSLTLSQFREFSKALRDCFGIEGLGEEVGIPLSDETSEGKCHYSEQTLTYLENVEYYQADPEITLQLIGRKCAACGLLVSEDARRKEKLGGANGKAIAKTKCPKCGQKFGDISLFAVESPPEPEADEDQQETEPEPAAAE